MKKVIGIVGGIGSGKDAVAEYISKKLNIESFQISQPIKDIAKERGIEITRENLVNLGTTLAKDFGEDYFAKILLSKINSIGIITGMRQIAQIKYLKDNSELILLAIESDPKIRFERSKTRGKLDEAKTCEEFIQNEINENSGNRVQRLFECMKMADHKISNNGTLEELHAQVDSFITSFIKI